MNDDLSPLSRHPLQHCRHYVPGLESHPWWDADRLPLTAMLEASFPAIQDEFFNVVLCGGLTLHPQSQGGPQTPIASGDWNIFEVASFGHINARNRFDVPCTSALIEALARTDNPPSGLCYFSVLKPTVHIAPHCGPTNTRIRTHLGLRVPPGAAMKVGDETRGWVEGKCLVFDDSWQHEVVNQAEAPRAVLLIDSWHPGLTVEQRATLIRQRGPANEDRRSRRKGWRRGVDNDATALPRMTEIAVHESATALSALTSARLECLQATASRFIHHANDFIARAARLVLTDPTRFVSQQSSWLLAQMLTADFDWNTLHDATRSAEPARSEAEIRDLIHMSVLLWRCHPVHVAWMTEFADSWDVSRKADLYRQLRRCGTLRDMIAFLASRQSESDGVAFAAVASLVVAAGQENANRPAVRSDVDDFEFDEDAAPRFDPTRQLANPPSPKRFHG